jgi:hypothetical protein
VQHDPPPPHPHEALSPRCYCHRFGGGSVPGCMGDFVSDGTIIILALIALGAYLAFLMSNIDN